MSERVTWEYKVRVAEGPMVSQEWLLGQTEETRQGSVGPIELGINELAKDGWDLMPVVLQPGLGKMLLLFRRPKGQGEGIHFARI